MGSTTINRLLWELISISTCRVAPLLAVLLVACGGGGDGGRAVQPEVSTWKTSGNPVDGRFVGCTDAGLEGLVVTSLTSTCLVAGIRVEQVGSNLTVPSQVIACGGGDVSVSGTGTKSSSGQVEIILRFETLPPLAGNSRWESFRGLARRDTFPLAWETADVSNATYDGACLISQAPVPVTFTATPVVAP